MHNKIKTSFHAKKHAFRASLQYDLRIADTISRIIRVFLLPCCLYQEFQEYFYHRQSDSFSINFVALSKIKPTDATQFSI